MRFDQPVIYGTSYKGKLYVGQHTGRNSYYVGSGNKIKQLKKQGKSKYLVTGVIEYVDDINKLNEREIYWIKKLKPELNISTGGGNVSVVTKKKIAKLMKGKKNPMYGKKHTKDSLKKMSLTKLGKKLSSETKLKMSKSHKGKKKSLQWKKNISNALKNRVIDSEWRKKLSIASKNYYLRKKQLEA